MTKPKFSGANVTVSASNKCSSTSRESIDYFDSIPVDLVIKILSKLSVKPMAKCRCVSKLWSSIVRRPNYDQLFPIKSSATPRLLFAGSGDRGKLLFYSSPQPQNHNNINNSLSSLEATPHLASSVIDYRYKYYSNVGGFVCCQRFGNRHTWAVISNPITGEYVTTPKVKIVWFEHHSRFYFGYDPVEKLFKVMCLTLSPHGSYKYRVLTLGTVNLSWRHIQCCRLHFPLHSDSGICINGVLYYIARTVDFPKHVIVCFDVGSENFSFMNITDYMERKIYQALFLIDHKGKLGVIYVERYCKYFVLWVLEDDKKHKWSEHTYSFPDQRLEMVASVFTVGMIDSGEIGFYPYHAKNPFFMLHYNLEKKILKTVSVVLPIRPVHTFPNFVEDVKLL